MLFSDGLRWLCFISYSYLLSFRRIILSIHFEEGKRVAVVVIHPLAEMVSNVKSPAMHKRGQGLKNIKGI